MRDEIVELYGAMREREEASWDPLLRNYYAGYCDALRTVYSFLTSESGRRKRIEPRGIEETAKAEETGKEPPKEPKEPPEKPKEPKEGPEEAGTASEEGRYIKACKRCGREFRTNANQRKYCQECSEIRKKEAQRECIKRNKDRHAEIRKKRRAEEKKPAQKETGPVEVRCQQCGKLISTDRSCRKKYCDSCIQKRKAESKRREREKLEAGFSFAKEDKKKQERTNEALNEMARIQKETGLSYGQQMARKYLKEEQR